MTRKLVPLAACMMMPGPMRKPSPDAMVAVQFNTTATAKPTPSKPAPQKAPPKPAATFKHPPATQAMLDERKRLRKELRETQSELAAVQADNAKRAEQYRFTLSPGCAALAASIRLP